MRPIVTPDEMRAIDAESSIPETELISRAGSAVAHQAKLMLGGTYGRRVTVVVGKGNNGADGRVAAALLSDAGMRVEVIEAGRVANIDSADLVIDAAYGTGFAGEYKAPDPDGAQVLSIDIPSGVDAQTGIACDGAARADRTVTFAALKPGLLLGDGPMHSGAIKEIDIGLDVSRARIHLIEDADVAKHVTPLGDNAHKWQSAVVVVAGSPGMMGAAVFASRGAQRAGAGMVRLGSPGVSGLDLPISEAVALPLPAQHWERDVLEASDRAKAIVVGPGLGRHKATVASVRALLRKAEIPVLVDGDALFALADGDGLAFLRDRGAPTVLTPHDGEFEVLTGHKPQADRIADVRALAEEAGAIVLLKGSTTVVANPEGDVLISNAGSNRLATAGSGDVLSGVIGAFLARGVEPLMAAAAGAHVHGQAARLGYAQGLVAGDLPELIAAWLSQ